VIEDYLAAEPLIIARLAERVTDATTLTAADLQGVAEKAQVTPAIHVIYAGDVVPGGAAVDEGNYHLIRQQWMTVIAVRSARGQRSGSGARELAGPLITGAIKALASWRPVQGLGRLRRVPAPRPTFTPGGFAYFPLQWELDVMTEAEHEY
jgi:hypothetical protein